MNNVIEVDFRRGKEVPNLERIEEYSLQEISHFTTPWEYPYETLTGMEGLFEGGVSVGVKWIPGDLNG